MANWVIEMNKLEKEIFDIMYTELMKVYEVYDEKLQEIFNEEFIRIADNPEDVDNSTLAEEFDDLDEYMETELNRIDTNLLNRVMLSSGSIFNRHIASKKQLLLFKRRMGLISTKITNYIGNFHNMMLSDALILLRTLLNYLNEFADVFNSDDTEEEMLESCIEKSGFKFRKLFNYKDMIDYAEDNGFVYKGSNGDHQLYEHKETNKVVVIPAHTLGTGIAYKIQKQIECGCVTAVS